jgi:DNA gyrase subunit A
MELCKNNMPDIRDIVPTVKENITNYSLASFTRMISNSKDEMQPIHRRIFYTCYLYNSNSLIKVSKLTGLVLGFHPHGDASVEKAIVRMAKVWINNHCLLEGQGNFGSIISLNDEAAGRYISVKVSDFGRDCIIDMMDDHCLDMVDSDADWGEKEPEYLPTKLPIGLINGIGGIAEAFTSDIPCHNLGEIVDRIIMYIKNPNISPEKLAEGLYPDYIVGGTIINGNSFTHSYSDRQSDTIVVRGDVEIHSSENMIRIISLPKDVDWDSFKDAIKTIQNDKDNSGNPKNIVISSINSVKQHDNKREGTTEVRLYCRNGTNLVEVLEHLYKSTPLEKTFKINLTTYDGEKIKKATLKDMIEDWFKANLKIRRKRIIYQQNKLEIRNHILEGLLKIYPNMDEIINLIRYTKKQYKDEIIKQMESKFGLTPIQARGIYEMELGKLNSRNELELKDQIQRNQDNIDRLEIDLFRIPEIVMEDVLYMKKKYGRERRTKVIGEMKSREDVTISSGAVIASRNSIGIFDSNNLITSGGSKITNGFKGVKIDGKWIKEIISSHRIDDNITGIVCFHEKGIMSYTPLQRINCWLPIDIEKRGYIKSVLPVYKDIEGQIVGITSDGKLKRFVLDDLSGRDVTIGSVIESCCFVKKEDLEDDSILISNDNFEALRIKTTDIPEQGRNASGVGTGFESGIGLHLISSRGKQDTDFVLLMENKKIHSPCVFTIPIDDIKIVNRTNKPKYILQWENEYICNGLGTVNLSVDTIGLFISEDKTATLQVQGMKKLKFPRGSNSCRAFDFIGIKAN